ncbi:hypothetical protein D3C84_1052890 [compost metagenome]
MTQLTNLSLFENNFAGQVPLALEKLNGLKEMNISYNKFNGLVTKKLAMLDTLNMTMINDKGVAYLMNVAVEMDKRPIVSEE